MIGVVVWSNETAEKAVIWCEDHAALAYLQGRENCPGLNGWPEAGDLLELDSDMIGNIRHARNVTMITEGRCPQISEMLLGASSGEGQLRLVSQDGQRVARSGRAVSRQTGTGRPAPRHEPPPPRCVNGSR